MPYHNGKRVTQEEYIRLHSTGSTQLHTGPTGENPALPPEIDPEIGAPVATPKRTRSARSAKAAKNAVAAAMGVAANSPALADIDVSGLDATTEDE